MNGPDADVPKIDTVFLDRDGTINEKPREGEYVLVPGQLRLIPGAADAIRAVNEAGIRVVVLTNQRCVAKGLVSEAQLDSIHRRLESLLADSGAHIDAIHVCPHEEGECECRKPRPGLFHEAKRADPGIDLARSVMIGDSGSDCEAAAAAGVRCIHVCHDVSSPERECARDLPAAVALLLAECSGGRSEGRSP